MGKVTIIVESEDLSTNQLYSILGDYDAISEAVLMDEVSYITGYLPKDLRVYIVPSDE
jgi:hypothetical protein